jgi:hypothetical protein
VTWRRTGGRKWAPDTLRGIGYLELEVEASRHQIKCLQELMKHLRKEQSDRCVLFFQS